MKALLIWAGYTPYQAGCLAPLLWALVALFALQWWCEWRQATAQRRAWLARQRRIRRARRGGRHG